MRISYWSTDVCSSDLHCPCSPARGSGSARDTVPGYPAFVAVVRCEMENLLRRGGDRPILLRREELLRVQRRHAAEARGRDRLAIDLVLDVARREDAGHVRPRTVGGGPEVALRVHVELAGGRKSVVEGKKGATS